MGSSPNADLPPRAQEDTERSWLCASPLETLKTQTTQISAVPVLSEPVPWRRWHLLVLSVGG